MWLVPNEENLLPLKSLKVCLIHTSQNSMIHFGHHLLSYRCIGKAIACPAAQTPGNFSSKYYALWHNAERSRLAALWILGSTNTLSPRAAQSVTYYNCQYIFVRPRDWWNIKWAKVHYFGNDMICRMPYYCETEMQFYVSRKFISFEVAIIAFLASYGRHIGRACGEVFFTTLNGEKVENL